MIKYVCRVILWVNGTFGVGKTTTANVIRERDSKWRVFDPEWVGYMLRANLGDLDVADFQELPPWRSLVPQVAHEISSLTGDSLVTVQSVLVETYWNELRKGFAERQLDVFHVLLDAQADTLHARITSDQVEGGAERWRLDHIAAYESARPWMTACADLVVDTTRLTAAEAALRIMEALQ